MSQAIYLRALPSTAFLWPPSLINPAADMQLFVGGGQQQWRESSLSIDLTLGAVGKASFTLYSTTTYRPNVYDEVVFYRKGVRRFGGYVLSVQDNLVPGLAAHEMVVSCVDYNGYMDRVVIARLYVMSLFPSTTSSNVVRDLVANYLAQFGVTISIPHAGASIGDTLFHYVTVAQAIAQLLTASPDYYVGIDNYKKFYFSPAGFSQALGGFGAAPYSLSDTSQNYLAFQVTDDGSMYRNKQYVLPSANVLSSSVETFVGDGVTTGFTTLYELAGTTLINTPPVITLNGVKQAVATLGPNYAIYPVGWSWFYILNQKGVFQQAGGTVLLNTDTLVVSYLVPFALAVINKNSSEIAAHGEVDAVAQPTNTNSLTTANNAASGLLNAYCPNPPETITFQTNDQLDPNWLTPGMTILIAKTLPAASGTYIVQQVSTVEYALTVFQHTITVKKNTGSLDTTSSMKALASAALTVTNNNATETASFLLAQTVGGVANPLLLGDPLLRYIFQYDGVLSYWSILFVTPASGATPIIIDALLNGVSIFPAVNNQRILLPIGQTTEARGNLFLSQNLAVHAGDVLTLSVTTRGTVNKGNDGLVRIVTVR